MSYSVYRNNGGMFMTYFNLICEELCITGGKVIYIDTNVRTLEEVHKIVTHSFVITHSKCLYYYLAM